MTDEKLFWIGWVVLVVLYVGRVIYDANKYTPPGGSKYSRR